MKENEKNLKHVKARKKDSEVKEKSRKYQNKRNKAKDVKIKPGDKVLLKQKKSTIKPPFDPRPFKVLQSKNNIVTVEREGKVLKRHISKAKKTYKRPRFLERKREKKIHIVETKARESFRH